MKITKILNTFFVCLFFLAEKWLLLVDNGTYGDSWEIGSATFKLTIPKDRWVTLMEQIRKPLGSVQKREILDQRTAKDPKGLPPGDYMVFFYDTSFSEKGVAHELVTMVKENDGQWRVLTYQVQ